MEDPKLKRLIKPDNIDIVRSKMFLFERYNLFKKLKKISIESNFKNLILNSHYFCFYANSNGSVLSGVKKSHQMKLVSDFCKHVAIYHDYMHFDLVCNFMLCSDKDEHNFTYKIVNYYFFEDDDDIIHTSNIKFDLRTSEENKKILFKHKMKNKLRS